MVGAWRIMRRSLDSGDSNSGVQNLLMATRLICLRHAEAEPPVWGASHGTVGDGSQPDPPLTQRGRRQAETVAHRLLEMRPRKVFVSEALRSHQTGAIIASHSGAQIEVVPALAEVSMGRGDREPRRPGLAAEVLRQWIVCGNLSVRLLDGETGHEVGLRMESALREIAATCHDGGAVVVGHVASLTVGVSALCHHGPALWGKPLPHATPFVLTASSVSWQVQWPDCPQTNGLPGD